MEQERSACAVGGAGRAFLATGPTDRGPNDRSEAKAHSEAHRALCVTDVRCGGSLEWSDRQGWRVVT